MHNNHQSVFFFFFNMKQVNIAALLITHLRIDVRDWSTPFVYYHYYYFFILLSGVKDAQLGFGEAVK